MMIEDIKIGDRLQFEDYGTGTHTGTVTATEGARGSGIATLSDIEPAMIPPSITTEKMAAFLKPAVEVAA